MTNYAEYRASVNIGNAEIIDTIQEKFSGYTKIQNSMVNNPSKYGVCLLPEAEELLVDKYGWGNGLSSVKKDKHPKRNKANRLVVYLDDDLNERTRKLMKELEYDTVQSFLESAIKFMVQANEEVT